MKKLICLIVILIFSSFCGPKKDKIERIIEDGVLYVKNPESPLKGTVELDIEKIREVDPYQYEEVGLKSLRFKRDSDGTVIIYDASSLNVEAHIISSDGKYLGRFLRLGQGPGEFPEYSGIKIYFKSDKIMVTGGRKLAIFDKRGEFITENRMEYGPRILIDEDRYFIYEARGQRENRQEKIILKERVDEQTSEFKDTLFFEAKNVGMIYTANGAFADTWATPRIVYSFDHKEQRCYVALNTEYKIYVKNLNGEIQHVIERKYDKVKLDLKDKKELVFSETWIPYYPDKLVAFQLIFPLPRGYLGVKRVSGPKQFEIDVFDSDGRYVYVINLDDKSLFNFAQYFSGGFATLKETDDGILYQEFLIKNLPEIFSNN